MKFGHFDDAAREYVIETPKTPYPWINYLGNQEYFALMSNTAGGYSFFRDAKMRRLLRYRYNNIPTDIGGRYLFINDGGDVWTPTWLPVKADLEKYECRHGLGYSVITGQRNGLEVSTTYFVPQNENAEIQKITFTNHSKETKTFKAFPYVEFCLWN
ncbi:MAG: glycosyl transferase, partial [Cellulomonadaceae bacterium]|nr:glycosyl transferase [Cellulomonadaceae bacterium]